MSEQLSPALTGTLTGGTTIREHAQLSCVCFLFLFCLGTLLQVIVGILVVHSSSLVSVFCTPLPYVVNPYHTQLPAVWNESLLSISC